MKYAKIEKNTNKLLGFYLEKEKDSFEVTDEVWQDALKINANCYENGEFIVKDFRTSKEVDEQEIQQKINEANSYLASTEWVENYKLKHDLKLDLIPKDSAKWEKINKREEYKTFLRELN